MLDIKCTKVENRRTSMKYEVQRGEGAHSRV